MFVPDRESRPHARQQAQESKDEYHLSSALVLKETLDVRLDGHFKIEASQPWQLTLVSHTWFSFSDFECQVWSLVSLR